MIFSGAGDHAHHVPAAKRAKRLDDAGNQAWSLLEPAAVELVPFLAQPGDVVRTDAPLRGQMPGAVPVDEKEIDVLLLGEGNADRLEHVLRRLKVQVLGVDQHAVVVPEDRFDHATLSARRFNSVRNTSSGFQLRSADSGCSARTAAPPSGIRWHEPFPQPPR